MAAIHQPHDKLFKSSMADIRVARDFFEAHLPAEILQQVNLETLKLEKNTFIGANYKASELDLIYSVAGRKNNKILLHLHCEHQSTIEQDAAFRLLAYKLQAMETYKKQHPDEPYPIIHSIIVYTGEKVWDAPLDLFDLISEPKDLAQKMFSEPYQLIDVCRMPDHELQKYFWCGLMEFVLKYRKVQDFAKFLQIILP